MANPANKIQHIETNGQISLQHRSGNSGHLHPDVIYQPSHRLPSSRSSNLETDHSSTISPSSSCSSNNTLVNSRSFTQDYKILGSLGKGMQGSVYRVEDRISRKIMALKVVSKEGKKERRIRGLLAEQNTLSLLHDDHWFVSLQASWSDTKNFYLAMEMHPTTLQYVIFLEGKLQPARAQFYMAEIIVALNFLHSCGIIHRDIKPANILLSNKGHIVLGDFGHAKDFHHIPTLNERTFQPYWPYLRTDVLSPTTPCRHPSQLTFAVKEYCGTPVYMAPEMLMGHPYAFGVDFWAAAVTLFQMLTGRAPWYADSSSDVKGKVLYDKLEINDEEMDHVTEDFLRKMLKKLPHKRLRIGSDMFTHSYFENIDWVLISRQAVPVPAEWLPSPPQGYVDLVPPFVPGEPYDNCSNKDPYPEFCWTSEGSRRDVEMGAVVVETDGMAVHVPVPSAPKPRSRLFKRFINKIKTLGCRVKRERRPALPQYPSLFALPSTPNLSSYDRSYSDLQLRRYQ